MTYLNLRFSDVNKRWHRGSHPLAMTTTGYLVNRSIARILGPGQFLRRPLLGSPSLGNVPVQNLFPSKTCSRPKLVPVQNASEIEAGLQPRSDLSTESSRPLRLSLQYNDKPRANHPGREGGARKDGSTSDRASRYESSHTLTLLLADFCSELDRREAECAGSPFYRELSHYILTSGRRSIWNPAAITIAYQRKPL